MPLPWGPVAVAHYSPPAVEVFGRRASCVGLQHAHYQSFCLCLVRRQEWRVGKPQPLPRCRLQLRSEAAISFASAHAANGRSGWASRHRLTAVDVSLLRATSRYRLEHLQYHFPIRTAVALNRLLRCTERSSGVFLWMVVVVAIRHLQEWLRHERVSQLQTKEASRAEKPPRMRTCVWDCRWNCFACPAPHVELSLQYVVLLAVLNLRSLPRRLYLERLACSGGCRVLMLLM